MGEYIPEDFNPAYPDGLESYEDLDFGTKELALDTGLVGHIPTPDIVLEVMRRRPR